MPKTKTRNAGVESATRTAAQLLSLETWFDRVSVPTTFLCAAIDANLAALVGSGRFDAVVSSDVMEHLWAPGQLIDAAAALLRPRSVLLAGTPYHGYWKNLALSLSNKWDAHHTVAWDGGPSGRT